jgi:hypothetical protein
VPLVCHVKHWPPHKPTPTDRWPLIPLTCVSRQQGHARIEALPVLFACGGSDLEARYRHDPIASLSPYLAVELVTCAASSAPAVGSADEGEWWGCRGVKVGVRLRVDVGGCSGHGDATQGDLWRHVADMVSTYLPHTGEIATRRR